MASPACASAGFLVLVCFSLCSARRLLLDSAGVHTHGGSSKATNSMKNAEPGLLHHPLIPESLPSSIPLEGDLPLPDNPFQVELLPFHNPLKGQNIVKNSEPKPPGSDNLLHDYVELPPQDPFQEELLPFHNPLEGQNSVKNSVLKPSGSDNLLHDPLKGRKSVKNRVPKPPGSDNLLYDYVELSPHDPFQAELLPSHNPLKGQNSVKNSVPKPSGSENLLHDTLKGGNSVKNSVPKPPGSDYLLHDYVVLPPYDPFQGGLLPSHNPPEENNVNNSEPMPPDSDLAHSDLELGLPGPPDHD